MFGMTRRNWRKRNTAVKSWGYRIHDGASQFRFQLEGPLAATDVSELDQCWRTAASTIGGRPLVIDVTELTSVDDSGRELLNRWKDAGARFIEPRQHGARTSRRGVKLEAALPWLAAALVLLLTAAAQAAEIAPTAPDAANTALTRYLTGLDSNRPWGAETVEIDASLPKLEEHGRLRAIRRLLPIGKPEYQVVELNGSRTVKQQVIARYLSADTTAASLNPSAVAVTPANYQFRYAGTADLGGGIVYVFQITPHKKREGLIQGA